MSAFSLRINVYIMCLLHVFCLSWLVFLILLFLCIMVEVFFLFFLSKAAVHAVAIPQIFLYCVFFAILFFAPRFPLVASVFV